MTASAGVSLAVPGLLHEWLGSMMLFVLRLCQSRAMTGSFYVKDVTKDVLKAVSEATGITDLQANLWFSD